MRGRVRAREGFNIWPGFVDALTTLLIMLLFVLTVFTAMQIFLGNALSGRNKTITELTRQRQDLTKDLAAERGRVDQAEKDIAGLRDRLSATIAERERLDRERADLEGRLGVLLREKSALEGQKSDAEKRIADLEKEKGALTARIAGLGKEKDDFIARIAGLDREKLAALARIAALERDSAEGKRAAEAERQRSAGEKSDLERRLEALEARRRTTEEERTRVTGEKTELERRLSELEARRRAEEDAAQRLAREKQTVEQRLSALEQELEGLRGERDRLQAALVLEKKSVGDQKRLTDEQAAEVALLNRQMAALRQQLAAIEEALKASESKTATQKVEIEDLGRRLNLALASQVQELQRYRSEFFGKLREILGERPDIRVVGDRFVFQSEVLFPAGSDEINPAGREQIAKLAKTLKEIAEKIPTELNWVLRVDGHTDRRPIVSSRFPSNWELSSARAIAVVKLMIAEGVPANRLVAAGFGEFQPLEPGDSDESYSKNRRIELKLTER